MVWFWYRSAQESYARLFFTTFQHFTEQLVQEALKHQPEVGKAFWPRK